MAGGATSFKFHCPACGTALHAPADSVGQRIGCPHCRASITIPQGLCRNATAAPVSSASIAMAAPVQAVEAPSWRTIVHANRNFVPLIECAAGVGSGLLVSLDGLVVTNRHVVDGAQVFMLTFYDGSKARGVVIHTHEHRDLAVVRAAIRRDKCFDIEKQVADEIHAGDDVLAIGHPRGFAFTSTRGIVSETRRRLHDGEYIQTDVAINPGNSGGPLLDQFARLVGLNTRTQKQAQGLGFAIAGPEVRDYVLYVIDLIKRREVRCPSDEEIARIEKSLTPWDIACAAVQATGLKHRRTATTAGQQFVTVKTGAGRSFNVSVGGNLFRVAGAVAAASPEQLRDSDLLLRLLGWQNELCGPSFEIAGDTISIAFKRSIEGLDVNEAREAILRVADAMDALHEPIRKLL